MPIHTDVAIPQKNPYVRPAGAAQEGVLASPRPCPVCSQAMTGRKSTAGSDRYRAAQSGRQRADAQAEQEQCVRELLEAAVRHLAERIGFRPRKGVA